MNCSAEVLDCDCENMAGNFYENSSILSLEPDMLEFKNKEGGILGVIAKPHSIFGQDCMFLSGTLVRSGNLEQIRLRITNFSV
tara:strand:- start:10632 stop:10880 length:249 start_codon:yes stop_codon:yes gene_type:complete